MDALLHSFSLVALAEMGDKTQLLSILLAAKFRKFWPICLGILVATLANHAVASYAGSLLASVANEQAMNLVAAVAFIGIGLWVLVPDKEPLGKQEPRYGAFLTSLVAFFFAEMGDKTQFATITLGAEYEPLWAVIVGTTAGMMATNIPAILLGERVLKLVPLKAVRIVACLLFVAIGCAALWKAIS